MRTDWIGSGGWAAACWVGTLAVWLIGVEAALFGMEPTAPAVTAPGTAPGSPPGITPAPGFEPMTQQVLEQILREQTEQCVGQPGMIQFAFAGVPMACISDVAHDRMRIIAPIVETQRITDEQWQAMFEANFHTALDARYATRKGVLYAAYIHPLSPLTKAQLLSALRQVANLAKTFGTTYTSGDLQFAPPPESGGPGDAGIPGEDDPSGRNTGA